MFFKHLLRIHNRSLPPTRPRSDASRGTHYVRSNGNRRIKVPTQSMGTRGGCERLQEFTCIGNQ